MDDILHAYFYIFNEYTDEILWKYLKRYACDSPFKSVTLGCAVHATSSSLLHQINVRLNMQGLGMIFC